MSSSSSRDRVAPLSGVSGSPSCPFLGYATTLTFAAGCEWGHKEVLQTMTDARDRRLLLASARADLLEGGGAPERQGVPDHVAASWRRSVAVGVPPDSVETQYFTELDLGSRLVRCAAPVIDRLAEQIAGVPMCVALS